MEDYYLKVVQKEITRGFTQDFLLGDLDLLSKYIVLRFFKTAVNVSTLDTALVELKLRAFTRQVLPFLCNFVEVVNSTSSESKAKVLI